MKGRAERAGEGSGDRGTEAKGETGWEKKTHKKETLSSNRTEKERNEVCQVAVRRAEVKGTEGKKESNRRG